MSKEIRFKASIAQIKNSLTFGRNIGRIIIEVPETEIKNAVGLIALQETPLEVVIRVDENQGQPKEAARRWPQIETD